MTWHTCNQIQARSTQEQESSQNSGRWMVAHGDIRRPVDALPPVSFSVSARGHSDRPRMSAPESNARYKSLHQMHAARRTPCLRPLLRLPQQARLPPPLDWIAHQHPRREHVRCDVFAVFTARTGAATHKTPPPQARTSPSGRTTLAEYLCRSVRACRSGRVRGRHAGSAASLSEGSC